MADHLAGLTAGGRETGAVHDIVEPRFEDLQQGVTGLAGQPVGLLVVAAELLLQHAVRVASLLLLLELQQVLGVLGAPAAVLARRVGTMFESLVVSDQVSPEATGLLGNGSGVTGHGVLSPF